MVNMMKIIDEKRALLRIFEAVIAILIVAGISAYLYSQQARMSNIQEDIYNLEDSILREISSDNALRGDILRGNNENANKTIESRMPGSLQFTTRICEPEDVCGMPIYLPNKEVYAKETFISATIETYSPKKFKIFMWMR